MAICSMWDVNGKSVMLKRNWKSILKTTLDDNAVIQFKDQLQHVVVDMHMKTKKNMF